MKNKLVLTLLALALILTVPGAFAFEVTVNPIVDRIPSQGIASYNITIDNPSNREISVNWALSPSQAPNWITSPNAVTVPADSSRSFVFNAIPKSVVLPSQYNLLFNFKTSTQSKDVSIPVRVVSVDSVFGFQPHISFILEHDRAADPREPYRFNVIVRNQNPRNLEGLEVKLESPLFSTEFTLDVAPSGEASRELQFQIDPLQQPGMYMLYARVFYPLTNTVLNDQTSNFEVISYSDITPVFKSESSWFKTTETITLVNNGNVARDKEVALRAPLHQRLFLSSSLDYEVVRLDGRSNIMWSPVLEPAQTLDIVVVRNYRPLVILFILAMLGVAGYYLFRSPVVIEKQAFVMKQLEEGVSEIKVRLYIKNRSKKPVYNINISDMLPRITEHVPTNQLGSLKPTKITKTSSKGTILNWHFESLESLEERIVTYKMKSTLRIVGDLTLPKSKVKYENSEGKENFATSGNAKFFTKQ